MKTYGYQHNSYLYAEYCSLDLSLKLKCIGIVSPSLCTYDGATTCPNLKSTASITEKAAPVTRRTNK